ncbi:MAG TPA: molecular chaperone TorD family protein [Symbiobacteriaceae bacterium]|nr:molecular chaperone TorD family protein [Symbiobacteriaceae bacterium]
MASNAQALARNGELDAVLEARGFAYGLLARAFLSEPSPLLTGALIQSDAAGLFPYAQHSGPIQQGAAELAAYLADPGSGGYDQLLWDYTRLFIGPAALPAPPYESAYRSADRLLFQQETLDVRQAYREYGLGAEKLGSEPDDHIGLELQFLYETCRLAAERAAAGDLAGVDQVLRDQQRFLDDHLLRWAADFAADVAASAQTGFYRGMAQLLAGYLPVDRGILAELLQEEG